MSYSAAALVAIAASQTSQSQPVWKWVPDQTCELRQQLTDGRSVEIGRTPTENMTRIALKEPGATGRPWEWVDGAELTLEPGAKTTGDSAVRLGKSGGSRSIAMWIEGSVFLDQVGRASKLIFSHPKVGSVQSDVPSLAGAVRALRTCESNKLRDWGIDANQLASLRSRPIPLSPTAGWFSSNDYPGPATMFGVGGLVIAKVDVGAEGAIRGCTVVNRQALTDFHAAVCRALSKRGKFKPAIDANGQPAPAPYIVTVRFAIER